MIMTKKRGNRVTLISRNEWNECAEVWVAVTHHFDGDMTLDIWPNGYTGENEEEFIEYIRYELMNRKCIEHPEEDWNCSLDEILNLPDYDWRWGYDK